MPTTLPFKALAYPPSVIPTKYNSEQILVTGRSGDTLTFTRAQGETSARSIAVGWFVQNAIFTSDINNTSFISNETPGGTPNGVLTAFTTASPYTTGSLRVFKNGIRLKGAGNDYTETASGFTMTTAPATGTLLLVDYSVGDTTLSVGTNSFISDEAVTGLVNSSNTSYTTARAYIAGSLEIFINGLKQIRTTDYTETTPGSGIFTMIVAPVTNDIVRVNYQYNLNSSGNSDTVDGIHASPTPVAEQLLALAATGRFRGDSLVTVRLDAIETTDINALAVSATTFTDFKANQNFTVSNTSSIIVIMIECGMQMGAAGQIAIGSRIVIDSAGTPIYRNAGTTVSMAGGYANAFTGNAPIVLTGLSVGTHTVKSQIYSTGAATAYMRPTGTVYEGYRTTILEIGG